MRKGVFSLSFLVHLFHGELRERKQRWHASGYHHESEVLTTRKIYDTNKSKPDRNGVYSARVIYREGKLKCSKNKTFFPREWTRSQVLAAIREVYDQKPETNHTWGWQGWSSSGIYIYLLLDQEGRIVSAFPKKERRLRPTDIRRRQRRRQRKQQHRRLRKLYMRHILINWMKLYSYDAAFVQITHEPVRIEPAAYESGVMFNSLGAASVGGRA
jgi:hypothetical protein